LSAAVATALSLPWMAGQPITKLALFEPPFVVDDSRPPLPADYVGRLDAVVADGQAVDGAEHSVDADVLAPA
jgi:hypothetical protein